MNFFTAASDEMQRLHLRLVSGELTRRERDLDLRRLRTVAELTGAKVNDRAYAVVRVGEWASLRAVLERHMRQKNHLLEFAPRPIMKLEATLIDSLIAALPAVIDAVDLELHVSSTHRANLPLLVQRFYEGLRPVASASGVGCYVRLKDVLDYALLGWAGEMVISR